ncbi:hypothetical protein [Myxococcus faecalis]|uniref:hypothetical protein n=1 Tax=Myxococcus faecalis TaxID=3115646 RepID=UPI003CF49A50
MKPLLSLRNVTGVFVGHKGGEDELALCCLVSQKVATRKLPTSALIPRRLEWHPTSRRKRTVRTDVLESVAFQRHALPVVLGPGDAVVSPGRATVGMVVDHPRYGRVAVTAGHAFAGPEWTGTYEYTIGSEPPVFLFNAGSKPQGFQGQLLKVVVTPRADYALVRPLNVSLCQNTYGDELAIGIPYLPSTSDIGSDLYVLCAERLLRTRFQGAFGQIFVGSQGLISNVLLTDKVTMPGDSGSCLVGLDMRAWGLLVGSNDRYSVFMQVGTPLFLEGAHFA